MDKEKSLEQFKKNINLMFENNDKEIYLHKDDALKIEYYIYSLEQQYKQQKEVINKVNKYLNEYDVFKVFSFPLMKRWEEEQIKSSIDYEFKTSLVKDLKDILKAVSE